jgi:hypothetical protein
VKRVWLSELDVLEWQELAGDRPGGGAMLKSTEIRVYVVDAWSSPSPRRAVEVCVWR